MGNIGSSELLIILVLALLLLGPKRLPEVGETLGKTMRKFRQATRDLKDELESEREGLGIDHALDDDEDGHHPSQSPSVPAAPAHTEARGTGDTPESGEPGGTARS